MKLFELLDDTTNNALGANNSVVHRPKQQNNIKDVKYSKEEILDLMSVNRDTYKRVNGRVKRR